MWIIPTNYPQSSRYAQDMVASSEDLALQDLNIEQSLCLKSKPMRLQTCLRKWKRDSWFRHLSGRILKPCQHTAFESELMSSLAVIPASHSQQQDSAKAQKTPDTSGHTSTTTFAQLDLFDASSRMSKGTSALDSEKSLQTWKALVTRLRGEYSARLKSARLTEESGCTSWPTPTASDYKGSGPTVIRKDGKDRSKDRLDYAVEQQPNTTGKLNPQWVEWLMGLSTGWTDLGSWGTE